MLKKEDWMNIQVQHDQGVHIKDIAQNLGVNAKDRQPGTEPWQ
jgi:hypothetical protein